MKRLKNLNTRIFIIVALAIVIFGWSQKSEAEFYIDAGAGIIRGLELTTGLSRNFGEFEVDLTITAQVPDLTVLMLRGGYKWNGLHMEVSAMGSTEHHLTYFSTYYRWTF